MRINRSLLGWGLFFIVLGAVPLAVRQGLITPDQASRAWTLWPILLILGGLGLLLRRTPIEPLTGLASAATFGLIAGGLIAGGGVPIGSCGDDAGGRAFPTRSGPLGSSADVEVSLLCGELTVRTADAAGGWTVEGSDDSAEGPDIETSADRVEISGNRVANVAGTRARWTVILPRASVLSIDAEVNAGTARLDMDEASIEELHVGVNAGEASLDLRGVAGLGRLDVEVNAGSTRIELPSVPMTGSIQANAGSVRLCAPSGVGLRLVFEGALASNDFDESGLVANGEAWETPGYAAAAVRIELAIDANLGSVELESEGSCDA